jgi:hypothetical protein
LEQGGRAWSRVVGLGAEQEGLEQGRRAWSRVGGLRFMEFTRAVTLVDVFVCELV